MNGVESHQSDNGSYSLEVKDFGPIAKANVELRPLTVFVGPSNTGKSYLAILIYALHQCFVDRPPPYGRFRAYSSVPSAIESMREDMAPALNGLAEWLTSLSETDPDTSLPEELAVSIRPILERAEGFADYLEEEMLRCFGADHHDELVRYPGSHTTSTVGLSFPQENGTAPVRYQFAFGRGASGFRGRIEAGTSISLGASNRSLLPYWLHRVSWIRDHSDFRGLESDELWEILNSLFLSLIRPLANDAFYLPADRTGVMHSHQVVVSTLIQNATLAGLRPSPDVPVLSGVLGDFLNELIAMSSRRHRKSSSELARQLENSILKGAIRLDRTEAGYPIFAYRPKGWKHNIPLMRASSMVSELAPVVLYLRHLVRPGNLLIIEEPESHLHPGMQAAFARELARLARSGVRIILTTHSEWFLEQLGNLLRLGMLPEEERRGIADADCALQREDVGAWLFEPKKRPRGSVVREVDLDLETGLFPTDFDAVSETLYNDGAEIFNRLQEAKSL